MQVDASKHKYAAMISLKMIFTVKTQSCCSQWFKSENSDKFKKIGRKKNQNKRPEIMFSRPYCQNFRYPGEKGVTVSY